LLSFGNLNQNTIQIWLLLVFFPSRYGDFKNRFPKVLCRIHQPFFVNLQKFAKKKTCYLSILIYFFLLCHFTFNHHSKFFFHLIFGHIYSFLCGNYFKNKFLSNNFYLQKIEKKSTIFLYIVQTNS